MATASSTTTTSICCASSSASSARTSCRCASFAIDSRAVRSRIPPDRRHHRAASATCEPDRRFDERRRSDCVRRDVVGGRDASPPGRSTATDAAITDLLADPARRAANRRRRRPHPRPSLATRHFSRRELCHLAGRHCAAARRARVVRPADRQGEWRRRPRTRRTIWPSPRPQPVSCSTVSRAATSGHGDRPPSARRRCSSR